MRKLLRNLGIIALVAMMGLMMMACPPEETVDAPSGPVSLIAGEYGPYADYGNVYAIYEGEETNITFWWFKVEDGIDFQKESDAYDATQTTKVLKKDVVAVTAGEDVYSEYKPQTAGWYTVAVTGQATDPTNPNATLLPSWSDNKIEVFTKPTNGPPAFYGVWNSAQFTPVDSTGKVAQFNGVNEPARSEALYINYQYFFLLSDFAGYSTEYSKNGGDMLTAQKEFLAFEIKSWTSVAVPSTDYDYGFKLSGKTWGYKGYTAYSSFIVYKKKGSSTATIVRTNASGTIINSTTPAAGTTPASSVTRDYTLQGAEGQPANMSVPVQAIGIDL